MTNNFHSTNIAINDWNLSAEAAKLSREIKNQRVTVILDSHRLFIVLRLQLSLKDTVHNPV